MGRVLSVLFFYSIFSNLSFAADSHTCQRGLLAGSSNSVRLLSENVMKKAKHVQLDADRVKQVVADLARLDFKLTLPTWDFPDLYLQSNNYEELVKYYLVLNAINYCFTDPLTGERFQDEKDEGSTLMSKRVTEHWELLRDPVFLMQIDEKTLRERIFKAPGAMPMLKERVMSLREVGNFLSSGKFDEFLRLTARAQDPLSAVNFLAESLPLWGRDPFLKRAQLFLAFLYGRFQRDPRFPLHLKSSEALTIFADYRVPQALISLGIMKVGDELMAKLQSRTPLEVDSLEESELRAASVLAGDLLAKNMNERGAWGFVSALHVDFLLWSLPRKKSKDAQIAELFAFPMPDYPRVRTTDY
jgi:hypothetical protein